MAPPLLPPFSGRCTSYATHDKCAGRKDAQAMGEFFYSLQHRGWIWGEDRMVSKLLRDEHKQPYTWPYCPFCLGSLPDMGGVAEKVEWADSDNPPKPNGEGDE